jgi:hypothetical protein
MPDGHVTHAKPHVAAVQHEAQIGGNNKNTINWKRFGVVHLRRPPMAFEALVLPRYLASGPEAEGSAALPRRRSFFRVLVEAVIASRQRAADREVARHLELRGKPADAFGDCPGHWPL